MLGKISKPFKTTKKRQSLRFDSDSFDKLMCLAASKNMSFANLVREACEMYSSKQNLIDELNKVEERLAISILRTQKECAKVSEDVQLLIALFDQLAQFLFSATPEVIDRETASATGKRRYAAFIAELHHAFHSQRHKAALTEKIELTEVGNVKHNNKIFK